MLVGNILTLSPLALFVHSQPCLVLGAVLHVHVPTVPEHVQSVLGVLSQHLQVASLPVEVILGPGPFDCIESIKNDAIKNSINKQILSFIFSKIKKRKSRFFSLKKIVLLLYQNNCVYDVTVKKMSKLVNKNLRNISNKPSFSIVF